MKIRSLLPVVLLGFVASVPVPSKPVASGVEPITGDYVEARTASVFAGACHYNGELVTEGRQAILAWSVTHGTWNGVDLSGVRAMASVVCEENLGDLKAARKCELVVDPSATDAQVSAFSDFLKSSDGSQLGQISLVRRAVVSFRHDGGEYVVSAEGFGDMTVDPMPNNECCTQPHNVWYSPLMPIEHRKVGFTETASYTAGTIGDPWDRSEENSAFYGAINVVQQ